MKKPQDIALNQFKHGTGLSWDKLAEAIAKMPADERSQPVSVLYTNPGCEGSLICCSLDTPANGIFVADGEEFSGYFINASMEDHSADE